MQRYLEKIARDTYKNVSQNISKNYGLLGGRMGEILFLYLYSGIDIKYKDFAASELEKLINNIFDERRMLISSFCNGLAGVGVGLYILEDAGFIEGTEDMLDDLNPILMHALENYITNNNYDFLHGAIGIGFYYLKHFKHSPQVSVPQINLLIDYLYLSVIINKEKKECKWIELLKTPEGGSGVIRRYNISLSHGMSSIAIFLARILDLNIPVMYPERVRQLLEGVTNYIINQRIDTDIYGSCFPNVLSEDSMGISKSRLAWCYGDLGIASALWQAGKTLNRQDIKNIALETFLFSVKRTELHNTMICDGGLCHGTAGVGQIFYNIYKKTQNQTFLNAYNYWKNETISMLHHKDGIGGHRKFNNKDKIWEISTSVLEGSAGVGLFLLSELNSDWDEILLLSFK